ncbi:MotA/TolQ/ExbB proton channel family protein [Conchiformibius steedae]|uniref:MotA/TolQ/ExbB proton channel family protein n=1 Tax=Conchiformibius steedae TaxID=153493 RepID=UPI0026ED145B|nr:MotA/TolQ/ExbB proton channel family protein [Conchiformibius steedae]
MNLGLMFKSGDPVLIGVSLILVLMSVATWALLIWRVIKIQHAKKSSRTACEAVRMAESLDVAESYAKQFDSPVSELVLDAVAANRRYNESQQTMLSASLPKNQFLEREISHSLTKILNRYDSGLSILASVGATAPFIGLLGTVWGIYHALINITASGQMSIAAVAGPIGEALVATAFGLFVAIPAVLAYNYFTRVNKTFARYMNEFAHDMHLYLLNGKDGKAPSESAQKAKK